MKDDENPLFFFLHALFVDLKKPQREIMPDWYVHICGIFATVIVLLIVLGALMYLKPKTLNNVHLSSWLPKFKCLGDVLDSVSLP